MCTQADTWVVSQQFIRVSILVVWNGSPNPSLQAFRHAPPTRSPSQWISFYFICISSCWTLDAHRRAPYLWSSFEAPTCKTRILSAVTGSTFWAYSFRINLISAFWISKYLLPLVSLAKCKCLSDSLFLLHSHVNFTFLRCYGYRCHRGCARKTWYLSLSLWSPGGNQRRGSQKGTSAQISQAWFQPSALSFSILYHLPHRLCTVNWGGFAFEGTKTPFIRHASRHLQVSSWWKYTFCAWSSQLGDVPESKFCSSSSPGMTSQYI